MRSSFEIDSDGKLHVHRVTKSVQAPHPVRLTRQAQIIRVQIFDKCSIDTLLTLIRQCRAIRQPIHIQSDFPGLSSGIHNDSASFCFKVGRIILSLFEEHHRTQFSSHLGAWLDVASDTHKMPSDFVSLARQQVTNLETAAALSQLTEDMLVNAAFYRLGADFSFRLLKAPQLVRFPEIIDEWNPDLYAALPIDYAQWITILAEIAVASRMPLLQTGQIQIPDNDTKELHQNSFTRLLYPIASDLERPSNYRLITLSYLPESDSWIL